jgi:ribosomal protein S12 methylthiotransferase
MYELCEALGSLGVWVRLHYVYPYPHVDEVLPLMAQGKVLPYLDIPFQHASPRILKSMKRPAAAENTLARIRAWREICPELTIRSTFIVGFPGETADDFQKLLDFLAEAQLDRVGCFKYSPVEGAAANALPDTVADDIKQERWERFMQTQAAISAARLQRKVGGVQQVIIDAEEPERYVGRSTADAPEIDGCVYIKKKSGVRSQEPEVRLGEVIPVYIEKADEYDLYGRFDEAQKSGAGSQNPE